MKVWDHPIHAVIFDCDGVLIDSMGLYYTALTKIVPPPYPDELVNKINGLSEFDVAREIIDYYKLDMEPEQFIQKRTEILTSLLPSCKLVPGVEKVLKEIHKMCIPIGVATSSQRYTHQLKFLNHKDISDMFKIQLCGDEVTQSKPSPEIFLKTASLLGRIKPENVLVFEDSFQGIVASNRAGMASVLLSDDPNKVKICEQFGAKPTEMIDKFDDFSFDNFIWEKSQN